MAPRDQSGKKPCLVQCRGGPHKYGLDCISMYYSRVSKKPHSVFFILNFSKLAFTFSASLQIVSTFINCERKS